MSIIFIFKFSRWLFQIFEKKFFIFIKSKFLKYIFKNFYYGNLKYFLWYPDISLWTTVPQTTALIKLPPWTINPRTFTTRTIILEFPPLDNYLLHHCTL